MNCFPIDPDLYTRYDPENPRYPSQRKLIDKILGEVEQELIKENEEYERNNNA